MREGEKWILRMLVGGMPHTFELPFNEPVHISIQLEEVNRHHISDTRHIYVEERDGKIHIMA